MQQERGVAGAGGAGEGEADPGGGVAGEGETEAGWGKYWYIDILGNIEAHSHIFNICNTIF